jgi:hypothetical protein
MTIILGAAMTGFIFINFFLRSWTICIAVTIFGVGCLVAIAVMPAANYYLFAGVTIIVVGQLAALIIAKQNNP